MVLNDSEVRILACLIEKELTTPEYYPLSLNALTNACNQKSNRSPVVWYSEADVLQGLAGLQEKGFTGKINVPGSRVPKYMHSVLDRIDLSRQELALLCELMLRGPQTAGELRSRSKRMAEFDSLEDVEKTLQAMNEHDPPLIVRMPREAGRKESRFRHLFSGNRELSNGLDSEVPEPSARTRDKIRDLEDEILRVKGELEELKQAFAEFKLQF